MCVAGVCLICKRIVFVLQFIRALVAVAGQSMTDSRQVRQKMLSNLCAYCELSL
jgi:hypothetical protein